jgi:hypothetical protein
MLLTTIPTGAPPAAYSEAHGITCTTLSRVGPAPLAVWTFHLLRYGCTVLRHTSHQRSQGHMQFSSTRFHHGSVLMCTTFPTRHSTVHRCLKVVAPASISPPVNTSPPLLETAVSMLEVTSYSHSICTRRDGSADTGAHDCHQSPTTHSSWLSRHYSCSVQPNRAPLWLHVGSGLWPAHATLFGTDRHQVHSPGRPHLEAWALLRYASRSFCSRYISATMTAICNVKWPLLPCLHCHSFTVHISVRHAPSEWYAFVPRQLKDSIFDLTTLATDSAGHRPQIHIASHRVITTQARMDGNSDQATPDLMSLAHSQTSTAPPLIATRLYQTGNCWLPPRAIHCSCVVVA